jgi:S-formylglutathione hydrolase
VREPELLVDQGLADNFVVSQLQPDRLTAACVAAGVPLTLRQHDGYYDGHWFIQSFGKVHLRWHAPRLCA